jgi:ADP-heptose:LPS heptosyltransferase
VKWINLKEKFKLTSSMIVSRLINGVGNPARYDFESILCIKTDEIGDMCYAMHVFEMLNKQFPNAEITVLCKPFNKPLLENSYIKIVETEWKNLKNNYDLIIDLHTTWKSIFFSLKKWPKIRLDRGTVRFADAIKGLYPHEVETNYKVVRPIIDDKNKTLNPKIILSNADIEAASSFISVNNLQRFALIHTGARRILRKWPAEKFIELGAYLYHNLNLQVVFTGDKSEEEEINNIQHQLSFPTFNTVRSLSLTGLAALMKHAAIYIGNESGPLHIAAISQLPSIGLYGPGPQYIFYPYGEKTAVIHHVLPCNPCDQLHCVLPDNPCIKRISVDEVLSKINLLLT